MKLTVLPLTPERWPDLETLFNAKGCSVARGCWCIYYRRSGSRGALPEGTTHAQANRSELKALADAGNPPGLIGYRGNTPVGWVSLGPRDEYAKLKRSPVMKAVDEQPVWSIDRPDRTNDDSTWFGAKSMYDRAGFKEVARRKPQRPIVRLEPV